jgi:hypothetical protein
MMKIRPSMHPSDGSTRWSHYFKDVGELGPPEIRGTFVIYNMSNTWHGSHLQALWSTVYHGELLESNDEDVGQRYLTGAPGVYLHEDKNLHKVWYYQRYVPLCGDGVFWAVRWEVRADRSDVVKKKGTDQWIQRARGVRLAALWVCGRSVNDMQAMEPFSSSWDPELEAHPHDIETVKKWKLPHICV